MKKIILFISATLILLYFLISEDSPPEEVMDGYRAYQKLQSLVCKQMREEFGMSTFGLGGGMTPNGQIQHIGFDFIHYGNMELEEARKFYINIRQHVLEIMATHQESHEFWLSGDVNESCLNLVIWFHNLDGNFPPHGAVVRVSLINDNLFFYTTNEDDSLQLILKESYESSLTKIIEEQSSTNHSSLNIQSVSASL